MSYNTYLHPGLSPKVFLPEPGKIDYNQPKSFRTITRERVIVLNDLLLKLQERVILWHMQHDHNMADSLSKNQFGFKRGTETETALHKIVHTIERRIAKKGYVLGTFLDIEEHLIMSHSKLFPMQSTAHL